MKKQRILLFGYGDHGRHIAKGLAEDGFEIKIVESDQTYFRKAKEDGWIDVEIVDVKSDALLKLLEPETFDQIVCVMQDEHLNVFLTLSLRSLFKESYIISISDSIHTTKKLKMAGANKVIDLYEVSANKVFNIMKKPVSTKILEGFIRNREGIILKEMTIPKDSFLDGMHTDALDISSYGILLIGMIDEELGHGFMFITTGIDHKLDVGDTIVCLGPHEKLHAFEAAIAKSTETEAIAYFENMLKRVTEEEE